MQHDRTPFHIDTPLGPLAFERLANVYCQARGRATSPAEFAAHAGLSTGAASCARSARRSSSADPSSAPRIRRTSARCSCCGRASRTTSPATRTIVCCSDRSASVASTGLRRTHSLAALSGDLARLADLDDVSQLLEEMEPDGKGAPVLLRQYLKLGGRLACFNVDESFSGVVDGLIVVDLPRTEPRVLQKHMGREQLAAFLACSKEHSRILADTQAVS